VDIEMQNSNFETSHFIETSSDRGPSGDNDVTEVGGLRGARIASVLNQINEGFADQQFSTRMVAERLGLSVRYVQDLLQGSGLSITDRIMELRLAKARAMLTDDRNCRLKISDVAASCGFNELSYFHRSFRRRFGASPAKYRIQSMNG
jgi:AraC-like DNA-binding protein